MKSRWLKPPSRKRRRLEHLVGKPAYESDQLDAELAQRGVEPITDGTSSARRRMADHCVDTGGRWKVQRLFAWRQN
jgi:hypothetical protein